jgi:hypothetical protein
MSRFKKIVESGESMFSISVQYTPENITDLIISSQGQGFMIRPIFFSLTLNTQENQ